MDVQTRDFERFTAMLGNRKAKALFVSILILIVIVVLQVGNLRNNTPMCELIANCKLRNIDVQRMQIALSKSGLKEFELNENQILVPRTKHSEYLQAIAEQNAIPPELRSSDESSAVANPFLSRSQQLSIEREAKKRQVQQMVVRLPFVEQAWLEMDASEKRSAFSHSSMSAVISIRPVEYTTLLDQHVDTVRQMIGGAIAGMDPSQVVVIDLSTGFAHRHSQNNGRSSERVDAQRAAFAHQRLLENRLRSALAHYPGLRVTVLVEPGAAQDQIAGQPTPAVNGGTAALIPATAGANGQASIYSENVNLASSQSQSLAAVGTEPRLSRTRESVSISIDVPYELFHQIYGEPTRDRSFTSRSDVYKDIEVEAEIEKHFAELQNAIENIIRPLISTNRTIAAELPISFNLIRPTTLPRNPWVERLRGFADQNWPSIAVLLIGLVLISIITQSGKRTVSDWNDAPPPDDGDVVNLRCEPETDDRRSAAEIRLSKLIEKDADAAAKVIKSWIRDAA